MTEGLRYKMFQILSYILQILHFFFTTPPSKITDFCHLPLHRGGFGYFFDGFKNPDAFASGFLHYINFSAISLASSREQPAASASAFRSSYSGLDRSTP